MFDLHTKFQKTISNCVLVITIEPENCRKFFRRPPFLYVTLYEKYYRDKSWISYKICCRAALEYTEAISAVVAPTLQFCAFRHVIVRSWKIKMHAVNVFL